LNCIVGSEVQLVAASAGFLLNLLFNSEDGSDTFLQNMTFSPNYTALQMVLSPSSYDISSFVWVI
jgi:hypothetical protein